MKKYLILLLLMISTTEIYCQNTLKIIDGGSDSLAISAGCASGTSSGSSDFYPLIRYRTNGYYIKFSYAYPLLIWNNIVIRDEKQLNFFSNHVKRHHIKRKKYIPKEEAEKMGIRNVPEDGVLSITTKKKYYFDLPCE